MNQVVSGSIDYCDQMSKTCETDCLNDKRTSRVAEANWEKVVKILRQFNTYSSSTDDQKNH
jgi:predicted transglutaminase-like cysteine proteinase